MMTRRWRENSLFAGVSDAGADLDHAFQIPMIFEQGAARLGD
jgi:hypothetical protein